MIRLLLLFALATAAADVAAQSGDIVFQTGFDAAAERDAWPEADFASWDDDGYESTTSLRVEVPSVKKGSHMLRIPLDLSKFRGNQVLFECMAKAEDVSEPPAKHLGLKFMVHYQSDREGPLWRNEDNVHGTFDWRPLQFTVSVAPDARDAEIALGLQDSSGTAWFDAVKISVIKGPPPPRPEPPRNGGPVFKGHEVPRLRGVMSPNDFREEDLRVLGEEWNANAIRWQMTRNWGESGTDRDIADYDKWMDSELNDLDRVLEACARFGMLVVIDLHTPAGGRYPNGDLAMLYEKKYEDHFVALWEKIARRYKGNPSVWGYDLVNEPNQSKPLPEGMPDYLGVQVRAAKAIRKVDPDTPIFIQPADWSSAEGFRHLNPVDVPNVIYEVHMYEPGAYTHQGVKGEWTSIEYPGEIGGAIWNKEQLRGVLEPVREFQRAYNVHIYVGEFSAIRWAPGAAQYLRDCIELFEEFEWDWTYHAYREWDGWSVEHTRDPGETRAAKEPTDRMQVLLEYFEKNEKSKL